MPANFPQREQTKLISINRTAKSTPLGSVDMLTHQVWGKFNNCVALKILVEILQSIVVAATLKIPKLEDRATLRSDLSAELGPKSIVDGWKAISSRWRFEIPFLGRLNRVWPNAINLDGAEAVM